MNETGIHFNNRGEIIRNNPIAPDPNAPQAPEAYLDAEGETVVPDQNLGESSAAEGARAKIQAEIDPNPDQKEELEGLFAQFKARNQPKEPSE